MTGPAPWPPSRHSQPLPSEASRGQTLGGLGVDFPLSVFFFIHLPDRDILLSSQIHLDNNVTNSNGYYAMPKPEYLIRTVIKNGTDLLRRSVDLQVEPMVGGLSLLSLW